MFKLTTLVQGYMILGAVHFITDNTETHEDDEAVEANNIFKVDTYRSSDVDTFHEKRTGSHKEKLLEDRRNPENMRSVVINNNKRFLEVEKRFNELR